MHMVDAKKEQQPYTSQTNRSEAPVQYKGFARHAPLHAHHSTHPPSQPHPTEKTVMEWVPGPPQTINHLVGIPLLPWGSQAATQLQLLPEAGPALQEAPASLESLPAHTDYRQPCKASSPPLWTTLQLGPSWQSQAFPAGVRSAIFHTAERGGLRGALSTEL